MHPDFSKPFEMDSNSLQTRRGYLDWLVLAKRSHNWLNHHRQRLFSTCQPYQSWSFFETQTFCFPAGGEKKWAERVFRFLLSPRWDNSGETDPAIGAGIRIWIKLNNSASFSNPSSWVRDVKIKAKRAKMPLSLPRKVDACKYDTSAGQLIPDTGP